MKPYEKPSPQDCLAHYGIKGMKWGVRRYQNYDGSYTRKGLERYRKAESDYENAKSKATETKAAHKSGQATRQQVKDANRVCGFFFDLNLIHTERLLQILSQTGGDRDCRIFCNTTESKG